jgi:hypothetical protein
MGVVSPPTPAPSPTPKRMMGYVEEDENSLRWKGKGKGKDRRNADGNDDVDMEMEEALLGHCEFGVYIFGFHFDDYCNSNESYVRRSMERSRPALWIDI